MLIKFCRGKKQCETRQTKGRRRNCLGSRNSTMGSPPLVGGYPASRFSSEEPGSAPSSQLQHPATRFTDAGGWVQHPTAGLNHANLGPIRFRVPGSSLHAKFSTRVPASATTFSTQLHEPQHPGSADPGETPAQHPGSACQIQRLAPHPGSSPKFTWPRRPGSAPGAAPRFCTCSAPRFCVPGSLPGIQHPGSPGFCCISLLPRTLLCKCPRRLEWHPLTSK